MRTLAGGVLPDLLVRLAANESGEKIRQIKFRGLVGAGAVFVPPRERGDGS